jgi:hypothetical protein
MKAPGRDGLTVPEEEGGRGCHGGRKRARNVANWGAFQCRCNEYLFKPLTLSIRIPTLQAAAYGTTLKDVCRTLLRPCAKSYCNLCKATIANLVAACPACEWELSADCS